MPVFGPEPEYAWCYYYQKANLARQRGDWDEVLTLSEELQSKNLAPADLIEWMPFLQAYARAGDTDRLVELAPVVAVEPFIKQQACQILGGMQNLAPPVLDVINVYYCSG